jgi:cytochrome c-type biogenesis protein CcmI
MIMFGLTAVAMVIIACLLFIVPLLSKPKQLSSTDRDAINKTYYAQRLNELEDDEQQGVVAERDALVRELQQNLLVDIPDQPKERINEKPVNIAVICFGVLILVAITLFSYTKTGALAQLSHWQQVEDNYPQLRAKYNLNTLPESDLPDFALALRSRIFNQGENMDDLLTLGEVGMRLNSYPIASQAFSHAYKLDPSNPAAQSFYGYLTLMYAQNEGEAKFALALLNASLKQNPDNLFVIKALAFYALESKDNDMMLYYWNMWLSKLPEDSPSRPMVMSTLEYIKNGMVKSEG